MNDAQICVCDQCGKPVGKAGSMTQWIFDPSKCSCTTADSAKSDATKRCTLCGYPITITEGSLTQWIFKPRVCTCLVTDEQIVSEGVELPPDDAIAGDRYHFQSVAGHGGAGTVFRAKDIKLGRAVAVKVIPGGTDDSKQKEYFEREARAASKLQHPNVVTVQDFGTMKDGRLFLVTEWIDGITLAQYLSRHGTLSIEAATEVFSHVLDALAHAHNRGVVHRDIKPNNIMLGRTASGDWVVKVIDFGTAREVDEDINATSVDNIACSPFYMSPEQAGGNVDQRTDLYSVGCSLFEALVGKPPFTGHPLSVVMRHQTEPPPHLSIAAGREFPPYLERLVAKSLEKQPENRFDTADDMKQELVERRTEAVSARLQATPKNKLSTLAIAAIAVIISAIAAGAGMMLTSAGRPSGKPVEDLNVGKSLRLEEKIWDFNQVGGARYYVNYDEVHSRPVEPTVSGIRRLSKYKVTRIDLLSAGVEDDVLRELGAFKHLVSMNVTGNALTDKTFAELVAELPELTVIRAERTELTDAAIKTVDTMKNIRVLELGHCKITASAFDNCHPSDGLGLLGLSGTGVTDQTVEKLSKLFPNLTQIELTGTAVTDACIPSILKLKNMGTLYLSNTKLTDKGARKLAALKSLKALSIETRGVSFDTLRYLDRNLNCRLLNADAIAEIEL